MLSRFTFRRYAKGKLISQSSWNTSFNSSQTPWAKQSRPSLRKPCAPWCVTTGPVTFENCKTTSRVASFYPATAFLNPRLSTATSHRNPRFQTQPSKTKCVEKFSLLARALIGSSEAHEVQLPDLV